MAYAIITSGFEGGSGAVNVSAAVADATTVLIYDDESKVLLGSGTVTDSEAAISVSPVLFVGQRIIAFVTAFGSDTYGAVIVTETGFENTGWKTPITVDGETYEDYLSDGGVVLPMVYDPISCRNVTADRDAIAAIMAIPLTFTLRVKENQAGTVVVSVENIQNAIGGFLIKFDADTAGTGTEKTYTVNGSYQMKIWGANQTEADAIIKTYTLVMPSVIVEHGANVIDLFTQVDFGYAGTSKVIQLVAHSSVMCQFKIDGLFDWTDGIWQKTGLAVRSETPLITAGDYTIRARNKAVPSETISREIRLSNF